MAGLSKLPTSRKRGWKKIVSDRARSILNNNELRDPIIADDDLFLRDLISLHPESDKKVGVGVMYFEVRDNDWGGRTFWIVRKDLSETDFSFLKCLSEPTPMQNFRSACRRAVVEDILSFKRSMFTPFDVVFCPVTGEDLVWDTAHVDHAPPYTFDAIAREFAATRKDITDDVEPSHDGDLTTYFKDAETARVFREFHNARAKLRVVSIKANLSILKKQHVKGA
jgi:hypothetical protein